MRTKQQLTFVPTDAVRYSSPPTLLDALAEFSRPVVPAMTDVDPALADVVHAHAPAATSVGRVVDDPSLRLRDDLGFDRIALAELAVAIEDAFGIDLDLTELDACRTVGDLQDLVAARSA